MKKFLSLAISPGTAGTYYYSKYFELLGIDASYEAVKCAVLREKVNTLRTLDLSGLSVSMPFKREIIAYLDLTDESVDSTGSCNTVKIVDGN